MTKPKKAVSAQAKAFIASLPDPGPLPPATPRPAERVGDAPGGNKALSSNKLASFRLRMYWSDIQLYSYVRNRLEAATSAPVVRFALRCARAQIEFEDRLSKESRVELRRLEAATGHQPEQIIDLAVRYFARALDASDGKLSLDDFELK